VYISQIYSMSVKVSNYFHHALERVQIISWVWQF